MADKAEPDKADQHKACILQAAHDYYRGRSDPGDALLHMQDCFNDALKDGSAQELFQKLKSTPYGSANVKMERQGNLEKLDITAGFWEFGGERESLLTFKVTADLDKKSAEVTTQTWHLDLPDWMTSWRH